VRDVGDAAQAQLGLLGLSGARFARDQDRLRAAALRLLTGGRSNQ
jgi:hypothetical protein